MISTLAVSLRRTWTDGSRMERAAYVIGALLFASGLTHLTLLVISGGTWLGPLSMRKPTTFGLSFGLTLASVTWATSFLRVPMRNLVLGAFTAASVVEVTLVTTQFWRGVPSHFNFETGLDSAITGTLAAGGAVIVTAVTVWTITAFRAVADARPSLRLALRFGFVVLLIAMGIGAAMIATGTAARDNPQLAYTTAGFLKPAHAVAMHAILVIPGLAWLLTFTRWPERRRLRIVQLGVTGYLLLTAVIFIESLGHVAPLAAPAAAMIVTIAAVSALAAAGMIALYGLVRRPT
jgi:hypothetical protein